MKRLQKQIYSLAFFLVMTLILAAPVYAEVYDYEVEGGNLRFDAATGTVTDCSTTVSSVDIPSEIYGVSVTEIGEKAFMGCDKLSHVGIPSTVTKIGKGAFWGCRQLVSITIPGSVTVLEDASDEFTGIFHQCSKLESVNFLGVVKRIPNYMFRGCESLKSVKLEYGVEEIGRYAFYNCTGLENITFPDSIKSIETRAFQHCTGLTSVTLGSSLKHIEDEAFYETYSLSSLYFRGNAPAATDKMTGYRDYADGVILYYPEGTSGWTTPTWNGYVTRSYVLSDGAPASDAATVDAVPSKSVVLMNGREVTFDSYNIKGSNYFKLRDLAFTLNGTRAQFEVSWDQDLEAVLMTSDERYTLTGGEMRTGSSTSQTGVLNRSKLFLDGQAVDLTAYTIHGNNYFRLRDIGELFNFSVKWDGVNDKVIIDTNTPYGS